eukprot:768787-Hanusia_phi.AAC.6
MPPPPLPAMTNGTEAASTTLDVTDTDAKMPDRPPPPPPQKPPPELPSPPPVQDVTVLDVSVSCPP